MDLRSALRIQSHEVVSFVGAGGKTTSMFRLAHELARSRLNVLTTTTTKIGMPAEEQTGCFIVESERETLLARVEQALQTHAHVTVARAPYAEGKFMGVPPEWVAGLRDLPGVHCVLVEADGARKLPFKAPRADEPVIPGDTTLLVVCTGMKALGATLDEQHVCRAEYVARLSGMPLGAQLDVSAVVRVMAHEQGGLKGRLPRARPVALLNQADDPRRLQAAQQIAAQLSQARAYDEVLVGATAQPDPIAERVGRASAIIMAAGASTRFGGIKQLAPWGERSMIQHVVHLAEQSHADEVLVVLGANAAQIRDHLVPLGGRTRIVINDEWQAGMSTSVRAGLTHTRLQPSAAIFMNVDQPGIRPDIVNRLIERHRLTGAPIVAPRYQNMRGNPVLWDRALFDELHTLTGDVGGREILRQHWREIAWLELESEEELTDTDTPEEYQRLKEILKA